MLDLLSTSMSYLLDDARPQPTSTAGSTLRTVGTSMLVTETGEVTGSLYGGCVEGAVFEACRFAIASGVPSGEQYGFTDDDAFAVGLPCGGSLEVLVQPFHPSESVEKLDFASPATAALAPSAALIRSIDNNVVSRIAVTNPLEFEPVTSNRSRSASNRVVQVSTVNDRLTPSASI